MIDYDKKRLKNDSDYRQQVLDKIAGETRTRWFKARLKTLLMLLVSICLFTTGFFIGGLLAYSVVRWVTVIIVCLLIVPLMGWMLVDVHRHRSRKNNSADISKQALDVTGEGGNE